MTSYDYDYLARVKNIFRITDVWATYSWGFSERTEKDDYEFLLSKLSNFRKLGLRVHAYIQGTNLVYKEFWDKDWFCRDEKNRVVTYYKGRLMTCVNNPGFKSYFYNKVSSMLNLGVDGIFVDNIVMGQIPMPIYKGDVPYIFTGCRCNFCQKKFRSETGNEIPRIMTNSLNVAREYLNFRARWVTEFLSPVSYLVRKEGLLFGTNSYDPKHDTKTMFGTDLKQLEKIQDYLLFENHSLPRKRGKRNNGYIDELAKKIKKPVFVVSYKKGIGFDPHFSQKDIDRLYAEQKRSCFLLCLKGGEYLTRGIWHNLYIDRYNAPETDIADYGRISIKLYGKFLLKLIKIPFWKRFIRKYYNPAVRLYMENHIARRAFSWLYPRII